MSLKLAMMRIECKDTVHIQFRQIACEFSEYCLFWNFHIFFLSIKKDALIYEWHQMNELSRKHSQPAFMPQNSHKPSLNFIQRPRKRSAIHGKQKLADFSPYLYSWSTGKPQRSLLNTKEHGGNNLQNQTNLDLYFKEA